MARDSILILLLAPSLCVGSACVSIPPEKPAPTPVVRKRPAPPPPDADLVDDLDLRLQARFRNVRDEDIHKQNLGTSRFAALGLRRRGTIRKDLEGGIRAFDRLSTAGWSTAVYVVEPGPGGTMNGPITSKEDSWPLFSQTDGIRELAERAMATRSPARGQGSGIALEARPVPASEASCLQCHRRKKLGEPLGAVVYAFRQEPPPALLGFLR